MDPELTRKSLLAEHETIRKHLGHCAILASRFDGNAAFDNALGDALQELRREIELHNDAENALIRILLVRSSTRGDLLIKRMVQEHLAEHAAMWALLTGSIDDVAPKIGELAEQLDAHMAAEERTFLASSLS